MEKFTTIPEGIFEKSEFNTIKEACLKYCYTETGRQKIGRCRPEIEASEIRTLRLRVMEVIKLIQRDINLPFLNLSDLLPILETARAEGSVLSLEVFPVVFDHARSARLMKQFIVNQKENLPSLSEISGQLHYLNHLEKVIKKSVTENGELRDDASPKLRSIRKELNRKRQSLRKTVQSVMKEATKDGFASDEGPTIRNGRMVIPIQAQFKRKIEGFVHDVSASGQTVYLEPVQALQINNEIRQLESEEKYEIERILRELTGHVRQNTPELSLNEELIGEIDSIHARVKLGLKLDGSVPELSDGHQLNVMEAYNPVLKLKKMENTHQDSVIPLNLELHENELALIITGPNAGGKSVAMKTIGLIIMMHQSGFPVPVHPDSRLPVKSGLFLDMGDDQSIENDLSTFSSRLQWMKDTLDAADERSLVLIDEAAAGTDPEEGGAIFQAFIEEMIMRKSQIIVTTHHGSLKVFAHEHPNAVNGSMEFDQQNLSPTYHFQKGLPGSSYAFEIARRMEVQENVITRARELVGGQKSSLENLIIDLEKKSREASEIRIEYESAASSSKAREREYRDKLDALKRKKESIRQKALEEANEIMRTANQKIEEAVRQIKEEGRGDNEVIKEARKEVSDFKKSVKQETEQAEKKPRRRKGEIPEPGDSVVFADGSATGEVVDIQGKNAVVLAGGLKLKTKLGNLVKVDKPAKRAKNRPAFKTTSYTTDYDPGEFSASLNIRGFRGEEAVKEVMLYLDKAIARGLNQVEIIHGKGEGILKKLVHEYLRERKEVEKFETAPIGQGGAGCTVVYLNP
ncbi:MAG TPA: endonuclease MutS2 [Balneolaceae bacterium]|nr:endonuclease MutS2 [Balneolaceae bacterium]